MNIFWRIGLPVLAVTLLIGCSDDPPTKAKIDRSVSISVNEVVAEGQDIAVTVVVSPPTDNAVSWTIGVSALSAAVDDYAFPATTVFVGSDTSVFILPIVNDTIAEGSELFQIKAGAFIGETVPAESLLVRIQANDGGSDVSFATSVLTLIEDNCATCHVFGSTGGLNLGNPATALTVRDAAGPSGPVVSAGRSAGSFLYTKTTATPPTGVQMPPGGTYLTLDQQDLIRDWIDQGCQNN